MVIDASETLARGVSTYQAPQTSMSRSVMAVRASLLTSAARG